MKDYQQACVSGFLLNSKKQVLVVKRSDVDDFLPGMWELPGGGVDFGENPQIALVREMQEEVGLTVTVGKPLYVADYFMLLRQAQGKNSGQDKIQRVEIFFLCQITDKQQEVVLSHEHKAYTWISQEDVKEISATDFTGKALRACFAALC